MRACCVVVHTSDTYIPYHRQLRVLYVLTRPREASRAGVPLCDVCLRPPPSMWGWMIVGWATTGGEGVENTPLFVIPHNPSGRNKHARLGVLLRKREVIHQSALTAAGRACSGHCKMVWSSPPAAAFLSHCCWSRPSRCAIHVFCLVVARDAATATVYGVPSSTFRKSMDGVCVPYRFRWLAG